MQTYAPGTEIGQYRVLSAPMIGGMGVVYICHDLTNDRAVALKTFKPEYLPDRAARDRFLREGTAWVELGKHPHIVRCYSVTYIDPTAFLVLELISKEQEREDASLRSWMGTPMPIGQALLFALQIARGMKHATSKIPGFVHRDLKPENILVGADRLPGTNINRLRITDFGLAAILDDETGGPLEDDSPQMLGRTQLTHGILGTPIYMAPEQWKGEPVGVYTDIYALGCILFEMLTGKRAVEGHSLKEVESTHTKGKLCQMPTTLPDEVKTLLAKCLALSQETRYQTWADISVVLENGYHSASGFAAPEEMPLELSSQEERWQEGYSLNAIGSSYMHMGKTKVANEYFTKVLAINRELNDPWGECAILGNLGSVYMDIGDTHQAITFFEQAITKAREVGNRGVEGNALGGLGNIYLSMGDTKRAIEHQKKALSIFLENGNQDGASTTLNNLGIAFGRIGDVNQAREHYERALIISRESGRHRGEATALANLGIVYSNLGNNQQSVSYYKQALAIVRLIGDRRGEENILGNLGVAHDKLGESRLAIGYYEQAMIIAREIGDRRGEGNALDNIGEVYRKAGDATRAIKYYEQSLNIQAEINNMIGQANTTYNMALLYFQQRLFSRALPLAKKAEQLYHQIGHEIYANDAHRLVETLQGSNFVIPRYEYIQAALAAFERANSPQDIEALITQYPFLIRDKFIEVLQELIDETAMPDKKIALSKRIAWLKSIAGK